MSQKFLSNIELNAGLVDGNDAAGTSGQVLSSTGTGVEWIDQAAISGTGSNKTYYEVKNSSGATILKGKGVMAVGTDGNSGHILIDEMVADGTVEPRYFMGILEDSLDNGEIGTVIAFGELDQFNTSGQNGETWTDGQILWCDPDSAGDFTITQPTAPAVKISAAFILKASTQGKIQIRVQANEGLHELHDTHITTQSDGEILVWDNTNEYWFNDGTLTVDYTNGRVGIGTSLPNSALEVASSVTFSNVDTFGQFVIKSTSGTTGDLLNFGVDSTNSLAFIQANDRGTSSIPLILQRYSGDVGIGVTPSSGYKLDVSGSIRTNSNLVANNVYSGSGTFVFGLSTSLGEYITSVGNDIRFYAGGSIVTTIDGDNSRFGIGTTAPSTTLEVAGDTYLNGKVGIGITPTTTWDLRIKGQYPLGLQDSSGVATFEFYADLKENRYLNGSKIVGYNQDLSIDTTSSSYDILLANNGGNVGVGTDSPVGKLTVDIDSAGTVLDLKRDDGVNGRLYLTFGSAQTNLYSSGLYSFNVAGTEKMRIDSSGNVTLTGALKGPSTFYIDPSPDDTAEPGGTTTDTGTVVILGDLQVTGTTTTIDSTTLNVGDKNIVLASNATTAAEANGAGITINGANATLTYASTTDDFTFNKNITANNITAGDGTADNLLTAYHSDNSRTEVRGYGVLFSRSASYLRPMVDGTQTLYIGGADASNDWSEIYGKYNSRFRLYKNGTETFRVDDNTRIMSGNLQMGSTTVIDSNRNITAGTISGTTGTFSGDILIPDSSEIKLGTSQDLRLWHNGTNSYLDNYTGTLLLRNFANDQDIMLATDDGSGGNATYVLCDGSVGDVKLYYASGGSSSLKFQTTSTGVSVTGDISAVNGTFSGTSHTLGSSNNQATSLTIRATNTAGSGAYATRINMIGYEGRAQGIFYLDETYSGKEWFSGLSYSAGFGNWQVGYDATGGQSEYTAQAYLTILESGDVGIGTGSPTGKFNSYISASRQLTHNGNGGDLSIISDNNSAPVMYIKGTGTADLLNVYDNTNEVFTIKDGGDVGIGNTSPSSKLDVSGEVKATNFTSTNSSTSTAMTLSYSDQNKKIFNSNLTFTFTGAGIYYFSIAFGGSGAYGFDITLTTGRNGNYRNFGTIKDSGYMYWETDGDFSHHAQGPLNIIATDDGGMYLDSVPSAFLANNTTDTSHGTTNYSYYIKRYAIYLPDNTTGSDGWFRATVETHGYNSSTVYFLNS